MLRSQEKLMTSLMGEGSQLVT